MSPEEKENKAIGRRVIDAINTGNLTAIDEVFSPSYVDRTPFPGATADQDGLKKSLTQLRVAFPDFRYTVEDEFATADKLVHRLSAKGTQKGEFQGVPATGKTATWSEIHITRIVNGKVAEHWGIVDQLGMMQQLGLIPEPRLATAAR
ncbi:MAG TPA: ester cyclase [bacterium]|jgi:predicted ester cyclase|nr:ester cyclase [bacterium]